MLRTFRHLYSRDEFLQRLQSNIADSFNSILKVLLLDGNTLTVTLAAGVASGVSHKLGRQPEGWIIVDKDASASVYRTAWDKNSLTLISDANVNLKVWVF